MPADPIACTLLAAASLTTGLRRAVRRAVPPAMAPASDPASSALAAARLRARHLHIPDSAIARHLDTARLKGQTELSAMNDLIAQASTRAPLKHR
ncbi:hypothetical protein [Roseicyclus marinus]|uniref:hypothetical protein n=1 Tax=Roseicyclus marinus TaxID=2161673 RepID=UPI00240F60AB|nr:hypothetical protein [Roseicyclus marinus]MDG3041824.1 hypothetical protein [Roseicyclus marinus]